MPTASLLPLVIAVSAALAGCSAEQTTAAPLSVPKRDLTLQTRPSAAQVKMASPLELGPVQTRPRGSRLPGKTKLIMLPAAPTIVPVAFTAAPVVNLPPPQPVLQPVQTPAETTDEHELPPGKTVTIIPASSGPSIAPDPADEPVTRSKAKRGGAGSCH
jgi:hypothetical protein